METKVKLIEYIHGVCAMYNIDPINATIVIGANTSITKHISDMLNAKVINNDPIFTEYSCAGYADFILKASNNRFYENGRMNLFISSNGVSAHRKFRLEEV